MKLNSSIFNSIKLGMENIRKFSSKKLNISYNTQVNKTLGSGM